MEYKIHNRFDFVVRDAKTEEILERYESYNILLNAFWPNWIRKYKGTDMGALRVLHGIAFGSGTVEPLPTDIALTSHVGTKSVTNITRDLTQVAQGIVKRKCQIRLEANEYVGKTISEVGMTAGLSNETLITKSLLKDSNGNPLSITKTDTTIIDIYGTFYVVFPQTLMGGYMKLNPNSGFLNWLFCNDYSYSGAIFTRLLHNEYDVLGGTKISEDSVNVIYDSVNKKITINTPEQGTNNANIGGIAAIVCPEGCVTSVPNPHLTVGPIIKEVVGAGDGSNKNFNCAFGRIKIGTTPKLYVNDVEVPATFSNRKTLPNRTMQQYAFRRNDILKPVDASEQYVWDLGACINDGIPVKKLVSGWYGSGLWAKNNEYDSWEKVGDIPSYGTLNVPESFQNYRFWAMSNTNASFVNDNFSFPPICIANEAPPVGSTVTMSYETDCIPKDSNSVLRNLSVTIVFGEYTPE